MRSVAKVSVIISTFNNEDFIERSINSVIRQTFKNWELILINDASTDNTEKRIKKILIDKRIHYFKHSKNKGIPASLNHGIKKSQGEYISILDADDEWIDTEKLDKQVNFLDSHSDYGLVGTYAHAVDKDGKRLFDIKYPQYDKKIRKIMLQHNCFLHSSVLFKKKVLKGLEFYDENIIAQDYDLFLKLGALSKVHNLPYFCVNYTIHPFATSQKKYKQQTQDTINIISNYKDIYPGYILGLNLWKLRKFYPSWFRFFIFKNIMK